MANPRKFSEKIALHNQKQAEETAAFEAILHEVSATTRVGINYFTYLCRRTVLSVIIMEHLLPSGMPGCGCSSDS